MLEEQSLVTKTTNEARGAVSHQNVWVVLTVSTLAVIVLLALVYSLV